MGVSVFFWSISQGTGRMYKGWYRDDGIMPPWKQMFNSIAFISFNTGLRIWYRHPWLILKKAFNAGLLLFGIIYSPILSGISYLFIGFPLLTGILLKLVENHTKEKGSFFHYLVQLFSLDKIIIGVLLSYATLVLCLGTAAVLSFSVDCAWKYSVVRTIRV